MKNLLLYIVKNMVQNPDSVFVDVQKQDEKTVLVLKVHKDDKPLVIGFRGRTIKCIKTILSACASQNLDLKVVV